MERVGITGATGLLGRHLVDAVRASGREPVAVVRPTSAADRLAARGVDVRRATLDDPGALRGAFAGLDAVVACAARYTMAREPWSAFEGPNVLGVVHTLRAAADAGVGRVVHVSSTAVYRPPPRGGPSVLDEDAPRLTAADRGRAYAITKAMGEDRAWRLAEALGLALTVVRPCNLYGAGDRQLLPRLDRLRRGPLLVLPRVGLPLVHARDAADALVAGLDRPVAIGRAYNLTGPTRSPGEVLRVWRRLAGGPRIVEVPMGGSVGYVHLRALRELGLRNRPLRDGLDEALRGGFGRAS